jgi:predicted membrane protein
MILKIDIYKNTMNKLSIRNVIFFIKIVFSLMYFFLTIIFIIISYMVQWKKEAITTRKIFRKTIKTRNKKEKSCVYN